MSTELFRRVAKASDAIAYLKHLGIVLLEAEPGRVRMKMPFQAAFLQPHVVHGGAIYSLADATAAHALLTVLEDGEGLATVEQNIRFLKGVRREDLFAEGRLVHLGRTIAHAEANVMFGDGTLVARSSATLIRLAPRA